MDGRIVVAMDKMDKKRVTELSRKLASAPGLACLKFNDAWDNPQMGASFFSDLKRMYPDLPVWIDVKLKDIPNTMANRVRNVIEACDPAFITIMADNTVAAMRAAVEATKGSDTKILAVTVLTSMNEEDCQDIYGGPVKAKVLRFARNAAMADVCGIVCSAKEMAFLRQYPELKALLKATPGIRPGWWVKKYPDKVDDQKRVMTAGEAVKEGSDLLVMGRPIYGEDDPAKAVADTAAEIEAALGQELLGESESD